MNEEIRNLESEASKLKKTFDEFSRLSGLRFISPDERARLEELQTQLQLDLGTSFTGDQLIELADKELRRVQTELQEATLERAEEISNFFKQNPLANFNDLRTSNLLSDETKNNLDLVAVDYATTLIEGFDRMAPEVQEAIRRMIGGDIEGLIDGLQGGDQTVASTGGELHVGGKFFSAIGIGHKFIVKEGETAGEAYARAVEEGMTGYGFKAFEGYFNRQLETTLSDRVLSGPLRDIGVAVAEAYASMGTAGFDVAVDSIQSILASVNPDELESTLSMLENAFPSIRSIVNLTEKQIKGIKASGGMSALRALSPFQNLAEDIFTDPEGVFDETAATAFIDDIFDNLITADPSQRFAAGTEMMRQILAGVTNIPESERTRVSNAIQDAILPDGSTDNLLRGSFAANEVMNRASELMGKGTEATQEDLEFLTQHFPLAMREILDGTADLNELQKGYNADLRESLQLRKAEYISMLEMKSEQGVLSQEEATMIGNRILSLDTAIDMLSVARDTNEAIKERFDKERNLLELQRQSIDDAKALRELQERGEQASRLSTQATRIGAVGTIEARFNQKQLEAQVRQMNRDLDERIQIAKIEAQDRILQDTQNQKMLEAQRNNTTGLRNLTDLLAEITGNPEFLTRPLVPTRRTEEIIVE